MRTYSVIVIARTNESTGRRKKLSRRNSKEIKGIEPKFDPLKIVYLALMCLLTSYPNLEPIGFRHNSTLYLAFEAQGD